MIELNKQQKELILALIILFIAIFLILRTTFYIGANYSCEKSNGTLMRSDNNIRCINLNNIDICNDLDTGKIIKKQLLLNYTINISDKFWQ